MDQLKPTDSLSTHQLAQGAESMTMFKKFQYGAVVTTSELARKAIQSTVEEISNTGGIDVFISEVDFKDPDSVEPFLKYWEENKELLEDLQYGHLVPKDLKEMGHERYPIFLFINPSNLYNFDEHALGSPVKSEEAILNLKKISKYGRVHVVFTPDFFRETGTKWADVPEAYQKALTHPEDIDNKLVLCRYLYERTAIKELGFQQRVENPNHVYTPTNEALEKNIIS